MFPQPDNSWGDPDDVAREAERAVGRVGREASRSFFGGISSCVGSIILTAVVGLLLLCGGGATAYYVLNVASQSSNLGGAAGPDQEESWDGKSTYPCTASAKVRIDDVKVRLPTQTAVTASGNCRLELVNPDIRAGAGIKASGNAHVVVKGGSIRGKDYAIDVSGNARVTLKGTRVKGQERKSANGKIKHSD